MRACRRARVEVARSLLEDWEEARVAHPTGPGLAPTRPRTTRRRALLSRTPAHSVAHPVALLGNEVGCSRRCSVRADNARTCVFAPDERNHTRPGRFRKRVNRSAKVNPRSNRTCSMSSHLSQADTSDRLAPVRADWVRWCWTDPRGNSSSATTRSASTAGIGDWSRVAAISVPVVESKHE